MNNLVVVGCQWGDEGKGKLVDYLGDKADIIVRFQGGNNCLLYTSPSPRD